MADTWSTSSGDYTLTVDAFPIIDDGNGYTTCLQNGSSWNDGFTACTPAVAIQSCTWDCPGGPRGTCTGTCIVGHSGGDDPLDIQWQDGVTPHWQYNRTSTFVTSPELTCDAPFDQITVQVTDDSSVTSNTDSWACGLL